MLTQCMFSKTKLLKFSICSETCLSDDGFRWELLVQLSMHNPFLLLCKTSHANQRKLWSHIYNLNYLSIFAQIYDHILADGVCPAGKVHETFQTENRVFPDLNLFFRAGLLMFLASFLLQLDCLTCITLWKTDSIQPGNKSYAQRFTDVDWEIKTIAMRLREMTPSVSLIKRLRSLIILQM